MVSEKIPELVFWFDFPPHVSAGTFSYVAEKWGNNVYYMCVNPLKIERRAIGWDDCDHGKAIVIIINSKKAPDDFVKEFVGAHPDAIHVCNGLRSQAAPFFKKWVFSDPNSKNAIWSECPGVYGSSFKKIVKLLILPILHRFYAFRYGRKIKAFLPLGSMAIDYFTNCGWKRNILFPFLYEGHPSPRLPKAPKKSMTEPLRLLYLGQFLKRKGIGVLIRAMDRKLVGDWRLDLVGRNGDCEKKAVEWAKRHPKVSYLGIWPYNEVGCRIAQYDLCVVPSEFDGWAYFTNEALHAGVGVIVTEGAASFDLIKASGAGLVVPAKDHEALRKAIQTAIDDPSLAESWKEKARKYSAKITSEVVGQYLKNVLEFSFVDPSVPRPECSWLLT